MQLKDKKVKNWLGHYIYDFTAENTIIDLKVRVTFNDGRTDYGTIADFWDIDTADYPVYAFGLSTKTREYAFDEADAKSIEVLSD